MYQIVHKHVITFDFQCQKKNHLDINIKKGMFLCKIQMTFQHDEQPSTTILAFDIQDIYQEKVNVWSLT